LADRILLTLAMLVSYGVGYAAIRWTIGFLVPARPVPDGLALVLAGAPLLLCLMFEWSTGLWERTPGTLGLGSLSVALPMLLAGASAAIVFLLLRWLGPELTPDFTRNQLGAAITLWGAATLGVASLSLALWRFWPEPVARLF
jgi:hypothetical protein